MSSFLSSSLYSLLFISSVFAFDHPGLLVNDADITRIKSKLAVEADPWQASWDRLTKQKISQSDYVNNAVANISRNGDLGVPANAWHLWQDTAAAFNLALRWKIEGNVSCAETASNILGVWGRTFQEWGPSDENYLTVGLQGYQMVNAAELLRDYAPFESSGNNEAFTIMFREKFVGKNIFFINHQAPSEHNVKHFHANWELANMASAMAFGIYTDNTTLFDYVVDYYKTGDGNGAIKNAITNLVEEPGTGAILGQPQEAGRDQGHTALDFQLLGVVAQQAWNQGEDLYSFNDSRLLRSCEYNARYNLGHDVPFVPWTNGIVDFQVISTSARGATRSTWELFYAHYVQVKGEQAPWTTQFRNYTLTTMGGFEVGAPDSGGSNLFDGLGWGSLLHRLDDDHVSSDAASTSSKAQSTSSASLAATTSTSTLVAKPTTTSASKPTLVSFTLAYSASSLTIKSSSSSVLVKPSATPVTPVDTLIGASTHVAYSTSSLVIKSSTLSRVVKPSISSLPTTLAGSHTSIANSVDVTSSASVQASTGFFHLTSTVTRSRRLPRPTNIHGHRGHRKPTKETNDCPQ